MKHMKKFCKGALTVCVLCSLMMAVTACGHNTDVKDDKSETTAASSTTEAAKESTKEETTSKKTMTVYHGDGSAETVTEDSDGTWLTADGKRYYLGDDGVLRARGEEDLYVNNPVASENTSDNGGDSLTGIWEYSDTENGIKTVYDLKDDGTGTYTMTVGDNEVIYELKYEVKDGHLLVTYVNNDTFTEDDVFDNEFSFKDSNTIIIKDSNEAELTYIKK